MGRRAVLLGLITIWLAFIGGGAYAADRCSRWDSHTSACASSTSNGVDVGVERTTAGATGTQGSPPTADQKPEGMSDEMWRDRLCSRTVGCYSFGGSETPNSPSITLRDVESFAPVPSGTRSEPNGWGLTHLPTNFLTDAVTRVEQGTVLGVPVSVRFTPTRYRWEYGDGSLGTSTGAGTSWSAEFTPTATSHVYTAAGNYDVRVSVTYSAEFNVGRGWVGLEGTLERTSEPHQILVRSARSALTEDLCTARC